MKLTGNVFFIFVVFIFLFYFTITVIMNFKAQLQKVLLQSLNHRLLQRL